jgi:LacI family transcriptional regulator
MKGVAEHVGVTQPTVSYVLTGRWKDKGISPETCRRVLDAVRVLGYRPSRIASALASKRARILGLVLPPDAAKAVDLYSTAIANGVIDRLAQSGYRTVVEFGTDSFLRERRYLQLFDERLIDALVLISPRRSVQHALDALADAGRPYLLINARDAQGAAPRVLEDADDAALAVVDHLLGLGRRRFCYVSAPADTALHLDRMAAFERAFRLRANRLLEYQTIRPDLLPESAFGSARQRMLDRMIVGSADAVKYLAFGYMAGIQVSEQDLRPDAVIALNDSMALGLMHGLIESGIHVPQEVSVVGWNNLSWAAFTQPALTTVDVPYETQGRLAAEMAVRMLDSNWEPEIVRVPGRLIVRKSCGFGMNV